MTRKTFIKKQLHLFKEYAANEISDNYLTGALSLNEIDFNAKIKPMYRFNKTNVLYTMNEIVKNFYHSTKGNREFLIELIKSGVENNIIEIV